jgi:Uma2 family endonuclease
MSATLEKTHVTLEELLASDNAGQFEIVDGQLVEVHVSNLSTVVSSTILAILRTYCKAQGLGQVFDATAYYQCFGPDGKSARKPDVSFIARERLPATWLEDNYFVIPPDLAVEVISPNDTAPEVRRKVEEYLRAGVKLVWEVEPETRTMLIHRHDGSRQMLHDVDTLSGENVVPGFSSPVAQFLP